MPDSDVDRLIDSISLDWESLAKELTPLLTSEAEAGARQLLLQAGFPTTEDDELWTRVLDRVKQEMADRGAELVGMRRLKDGSFVRNPSAAWSITETTRDSLRTLLSQSIEEGWSAGKTSSTIQESESFSPARALTIARTESAFARARGTHIGATEAGMKTKSWIMSNEGTCDECEANADQGEIPIAVPFESGDDCPPAHPNCRCACGYQSESDEDEE